MYSISHFKHKKMRNNLLILLCIPFLVSAQDKKNTKENLFKVNILTPGFSFEKGVSMNSTFCLDTNISLGLTVHNNTTTVLKSPFIRGQYRYYYNLEKRVSKGKDISNNSGCFIAVSTSYYCKPIGNDLYISNYDGFTLGGIWGFQKSYKSGINLSDNTGIGYNLSNNQSHKILPILNFTVGYRLF